MREGTYGRQNPAPLQVLPFYSFYRTRRNYRFPTFTISAPLKSLGRASIHQSLNRRIDAWGIPDSISEAITVPTDACTNHRIRRQTAESMNLRINARIDRRIRVRSPTEGPETDSGMALLAGYEPIIGGFQLGGASYG